MNQISIKGAYTVLVTPFKPDGELHEEGLRQNIRYQIKNGIDGLVILGTTGEAPTLTQKEKERIITIARKETKDKVHLMVGTGNYSTKVTIENSLAAQEAGVDSLLVVTPYYNKPTQEGLYQHYAALADAVKLPIVIYNIQGRTGQNLQTETLKRLAAIPQIVGVKEASGNINQMMEVIETVLPERHDFSVMCGDDALTFPLMALGGHGIYSVAGNIIPQQIKDLCDACFKGDYAEARKVHYEILPFVRSLFLETNPIPIKAVMNFFEMTAGPCRLPLCEMSPENHEKLMALWKTVSIGRYERVIN